jgi:hypothetical protein
LRRSASSAAVKISSLSFSWGDSCIFQFWILDFGFWILDFGFWILPNPGKATPFLSNPFSLCRDVPAERLYD